MEIYTPKQARQLADITQANLAKQLGISVPTLIRYEQNPDLMPLGMAKQLARILKRPIDAFFIYPSK